MRKTQRFKLLLERGYFPAELPPPFVTSQFAKFRQTIETQWSNQSPNYPNTTQEIYSIPLVSGLRRNLAVVNPISQLYLSKIISDNWTEIRRHLKKKSFSDEVPEIKSDQARAISSPDFNLSSLRKTAITSQFDYALVSDISRFYGTIYTHAIPWALHGKAWSKRNLRSPIYNRSLGNKLDVAVRKGQGNQTLGIPVGPDTSRILSEIIAVSIDDFVIQRITNIDDGAFRQIDDWFMGFDSTGSAESAIAVLASACQEYEMELNSEKTKVLRAAASVEHLWPGELRGFVFGSSTQDQRRALTHYFVKAFQYHEDFSTQNVLDFAVKRTRTIAIDQSNWPVYEMYLLKAGRSNPLVIPAVVDLFSTYSNQGYPLDKNRILKFVGDIIQKNAPLSHHMEVSWVLFLAKILNLKLKKKHWIPLCQLNSSICALITLDLESRGQIVGRLDKSNWAGAMSTDGLKSNMWLLAYEASLKGWLSGHSVNYVNNDPYFNILMANNISFYDTNRSTAVQKRSRPHVTLPPIANMARSIVPFS